MEDLDTLVLRTVRDWQADGLPVVHGDRGPNLGFLASTAGLAHGLRAAVVTLTHDPRIAMRPVSALAKHNSHTSKGNHHHV